MSEIANKSTCENMSVSKILAMEPGPIRLQNPYVMHFWASGYGVAVLHLIPSRSKLYTEDTSQGCLML